MKTRLSYVLLSCFCLLFYHRDNENLFENKSAYMNTGQEKDKLLRIKLTDHFALVQLC